MSASVCSANRCAWTKRASSVARAKQLVVAEQNQTLRRYSSVEFDRTELPVGTYPKMKSERRDEEVSVPKVCTD